jgi:hypothetical protein
VQVLLRRVAVRIASLVVATFCLFAGPASADLVDGPRATRSANLTKAYLHTWSTNTRAALADVPRIYAARVNFYGRTLDHRALVREKAQFARRWPTRRYSLRPGTMRVRCDERARQCLVQAVIDWRTESRVRKAASSGSSTFLQAMNVASRPLVFRESGAVIRSRRTPAQG